MPSKEEIDNLKKSVESLASPLEEAAKAMDSMFDLSEKLNQTFVMGRTRMDELGDAISRSAAGVIRLGGDAAAAAAALRCRAHRVCPPRRAWARPRGPARRCRRRR